MCTRTINFDHTLSHIPLACGLTENQIEALDTFGVKLCDKLNDDEHFKRASQVVEQVIMDTRIILGEDPNALVTEKEAVLAVYAHISGNLYNQQESPLDELLSAISKKFEEE